MVNEEGQDPVLWGGAATLKWLREIREWHTSGLINEVTAIGLAREAGWQGLPDPPKIDIPSKFYDERSE